ncbi:hypothetical protein EBZ35_08505 [bacterium]|nr:hypothetical protein [bacterium]
MPIGLTMAPIFPWTRTAVSVVMAIVVGIGGYIFFYSALKKLPTTNAAVLSYLEVIFTIIIAAIFMSEPISIATVIGGSLILAGSIGAQLFQPAPSRS